MTPALPHATIFLLTYNQEHLVREAVRSVLAQDYPDLQIILSDDRSSDNTFAVLQKEAAAYRGPHRLLVRQPPRNLGLVYHLYDVAAVATGELLVCAEGDDIAYPHRVRRLVEEWRATDADALVSNWDVIDEQGKILQRGRSEGSSDLQTNRYFPGRPMTLLTGATAAYSAEALRRIPPPSEPVFAEDLYVSLLLAWRGRTIRYVDEPLVAYRQHPSALTHVDRRRQTIAEQEAEVARWSAKMAVQLRLVGGMLDDAPPGLAGWGKPVAANRALIHEDAAFNDFRARWIDSSFADRLRAVIRFKNRHHRRWLASRMFGIPGVSAMRWLRGLAIPNAKQR